LKNDEEEDTSRKNLKDKNQKDFLKQDQNLDKDENNAKRN
jgi:hypothetical protein